MTYIKTNNVPTNASEIIDDDSINNSHTWSSDKINENFMPLIRVNGTCSTISTESNKIVNISNYKGVMPAEVAVVFEYGNSYGDITLESPTYPTITFKDSNDNELGTFDVCDSVGNFAGSGCWGDGNMIIFSIANDKAMISNNQVRQKTTEYTIYSDNTTVYNKESIDSTLNNYASVDSVIMKTATEGQIIYADTMATDTPLHLDNGSGGGCYMGFRNKGTSLGYFGYDSQNKPSAYFNGQNYHLLLDSITKEYGTLTVSTNNYMAMGTNVPTGKKIVGFNVDYWSSNSGVFTIIPYNGNNAYLIGNNGTIVVNLKITWFYI